MKGRFRLYPLDFENAPLVLIAVEPLHFTDHEPHNAAHGRDGFFFHSHLT